MVVVGKDMGMCESIVNRVSLSAMYTLRSKPFTGACRLCLGYPIDDLLQRKGHDNIGHVKYNGMAVDACSIRNNNRHFCIHRDISR